MWFGLWKNAQKLNLPHLVKRDMLWFNIISYYSVDENCIPGDTHTNTHDASFEQWGEEADSNYCSITDSYHRVQAQQACCSPTESAERSACPEAPCWASSSLYWEDTLKLILIFKFMNFPNIVAGEVLNTYPSFKMLWNKQLQAISSLSYLSVDIFQARSRKD